MVTIRTQVGIVGSGPAGLLLGHILRGYGIDSVVLENRDRAYVEARQRAGMLEQDVADLLRDLGLGARMDAQGFVHDGIDIQFDRDRHRFDFRALAGRGLQVWAQTEVVKDLVAARLAAGAALEFGVRDVTPSGLHSQRPRIRYRDAAGRDTELRCDVVAGCDGFHGPSRAALPAGALTVHQRTHPYAWLGILADVPPSTDQVLYASHPDGFALHSLRSDTVSRLYLQVDPDEDLAGWPDERIWKALQTRLAGAGWTLAEGPITAKNIAPMRSFVAGPMRHGRMFLAGDAAHIVPPTGAKGLNLAVADVVSLARALVRWLRDGDPEAARRYDRDGQERAWRTVSFTNWLTDLLHVPPGQDPFDRHRQRAEFHRLTSSTAAARAFAESYIGQRLPELP